VPFTNETVSRDLFKRSDSADHRAELSANVYPFGFRKLAPSTLQGFPRDVFHVYERNALIRRPVIDLRYRDSVTE